MILNTMKGICTSKCIIKIASDDRSDTIAYLEKKRTLKIIIVGQMDDICIY